MGAEYLSNKNITGVEVMTIFQVLQATGLPCAYAHFKHAQNPPYIVYIGSGQDIFSADDTHYHTRNRYQVEYYYTTKNEANETAIESSLLANGFLYEKSEDIYIEGEDVFVIYYYI